MTKMETRPELYITFTNDDETDDGVVLDVAGSIEEARSNISAIKRCGFCYRVVRDTDGRYGNTTFIEVIGGTAA